MGYEYITQPQIFTSPITALNGIYGVNEAYPLLTTYQTWTSTAAVNASAFPIPGSWTMLNEPGSFLVTVGGVLQPPTEYLIDRDFRLLTFFTPVCAGIEVGVTQLATAAPSSQNFSSLFSLSAEFVNLSARSGIFESLLVTNLTGLSTVVNIIDVLISEVSGFRSTGDVQIEGDVSITKNIYLSGSLNLGLGNINSQIVTTNLTAQTITLADNGSITGSTSATSISVNTLSAANINSTLLNTTLLSANAVNARSISLTHDPANDGVDPIFDIGETQTNSFSGFRMRYEESTNRLICSSRTGTTILSTFIITTNTGQIGISGLPNTGQALTVTGNISASNNIQAENLSKYFILSADLPTRQISAITPFFDPVTMVNLASAKNYKINYDLYFANITPTNNNLRFVLSASNDLVYVNSNYITTVAAGITGTAFTQGTPQMGSMFAPATSIVILPSFTYNANSFHNSLIQAVVQTNNACSFNISLSGNAATSAALSALLVPKRGSSRVVQLME